MGLKVMFVDDEPEVLKVFKALAEPLGYDVVTLANSAEAAQQLQKEKFDGVFVDASMPQPDGFELAKIARASTSNFGTPIAMVTGYSDVETMRKGFQSGITFFLGKPLSQQRLVLLLRSMRGAVLREKRRYARLPFRAVVTFHVGEKKIRSESLNISEGGILLEKSGGASTGAELDLEFSLPQATRPLKVHGKVVRVEPPDEIGVQFLALNIDAQEAVQAYVRGKIKE